MEIGSDSFAAILPFQRQVSPHREADLLEEIEIADQVGLDVFAMGEQGREGPRCAALTEASRRVLACSAGREIAARRLSGMIFQISRRSAILAALEIFRRADNCELGNQQVDRRIARWSDLGELRRRARGDVPLHLAGAFRGNKTPVDAAVIRHSAERVAEESSHHCDVLADGGIPAWN
jgi:hypothetical protein